MAETIYPDDMPNEDELDEALLAAARENREAIQDIRTAQVHNIVDAMLANRSVWVWSKLGHWMEVRVFDVKATGIVAVRTHVGALLTFEPGAVRLEDPTVEVL